MTFKQLDSTKKYASDSKKLASFHELYEEKISLSNIDKYRKGFNEDSRFKSFSVDVYFSAYTGEYGSSSVYTALSLSDSKAVGESLIEYLRLNEKEVIKGMSKILAEKANSITYEAKQEIAKAMQEVAEIERYIEMSGK